MATLISFLIPILIFGALFFLYKRSKNANGSSSSSPVNSNPPVNQTDCDSYFNNLGIELIGINYVDCDGNSITNQIVNPNQSIYVKPGTLNGGDSGFLIKLG